MKKLEPLSLDGIKTYSLSERHSKVSCEDFGRPWRPGGSFREFADRLPRILAGADLREVAAAWVQARKQGRPVLLGMGAHPIKVGLSPVLIDLLRAGADHRRGHERRRHHPRRRGGHGGPHLGGCG